MQGGEEKEGSPLELWPCRGVFLMRKEGAGIVTIIAEEKIVKEGLFRLLKLF